VGGLLNFPPEAGAGLVAGGGAGLEDVLGTAELVLGAGADDD
jgi:hypothetical protein